MSIGPYELTQGRLYLGTESVRLGLVDAIEKAADLAGVSHYDLVDVNERVLREKILKVKRLLATGVVLTLDRLSSDVVMPYVMSLSVKMVISVWMFLMVRGRSRLAASLRPYLEARPPATTGLGRVARAVAGYNRRSDPGNRP